MTRPEKRLELLDRFKREAEAEGIIAKVSAFGVLLLVIPDYKDPDEQMWMEILEREIDANVQVELPPKGSSESNSGAVGG